MNADSAKNADGEILFVFGAARSGTTYVANLLAELFDYGMGPEGHFVQDFARRLARYGDLNKKPNMERLLSDIRRASTLSIIRNDWPANEQFDVTLEDLHAELAEATYPAVVYSVFQCIAKHMSKSRVGTKNPRYATCLPMIEGMFAQRAKYLNVVRDGRDVALSTMQVPWGQNTVYACAKAWAEHLNAAAKFEQTVAPGRYLNIAYEKLIEDPQTVLTALEGFLGTEVNPAQKSEFLQKAAASNLAGNFGKWKSQMSQKDIERFEGIAGSELSKWNYERLFDGAALGVVEQACFEAEEFSRKVIATLKALAKRRATRV